MRKIIWLVFIFFSCLSDNHGGVLLDNLNTQDSASFLDDIYNNEIKNEINNFIYINECPDGKCADPFLYCIQVDDPENTGFKSICTVNCSYDPLNDIEFLYSDLGGNISGTCKDFLGIDDACCGNPYMDFVNHFFCLPGNQCCGSGNGKPIRCGNICCKEGSKCNQETGECSEGCGGLTSVSCGDKCCSKEEYCDYVTMKCEKVCQNPTPLICGSNCCPNNYECVCESEGGFCLPGGARLCSCQGKLKKAIFCPPMQKCIITSKCQSSGFNCMPLGAIECPLADNCFCDPGMVCTGDKNPACCPSDNPIPCLGKNYCCPFGNICVELKDNPQGCMPENWTYCEGGKIMCPPGYTCSKFEKKCILKGMVECLYGNICPPGYICVTDYSGENYSGCCPADKPVECKGYCCPSGTHCEAGCGGCVTDGFKCCGKNGICPKDKICWQEGKACLDSSMQDCGDFYCNSTEVCAGWNPPLCCPVDYGYPPMVCNLPSPICCKSTEKCCGDKCYNEKDLNEKCCLIKNVGYKVCPGGYKCGLLGKGCIPETAVECPNGNYCSVKQRCYSKYYNITGEDAEYVCAAENVELYPVGCNICEQFVCPAGYEVRSNAKCLSPKIFCHCSFFFSCCKKDAPYLESDCDMNGKIDMKTGCPPEYEITIHLDDISTPSTPPMPYIK